MRTVIFANGNPPDRAAITRLITPVDRIIAADGGAHHALSVGVMPQVVIGDLDSLPPPDRVRLERSGVQLIVYPTRKDFTDLELAIRFALAEGATQIIIFCALGGRWDQSLANLMLLTLPELAAIPTQIVQDHTTISVIRGRTELNGQVGDTLSLVALQGDAQGVTIEGVEYPLCDATLPFGATLGISNVLTESTAKITVKHGVILAVHAAREE
jgi:thiamine pyrophosphokinase